MLANGGIVVMTENTMTEMDKLAHLLEHWQGHNNDHAANYRSWAKKARQAGLAETAALLNEAARATDSITEMFAKAGASIG